jgi:hypothetical protein
VASPAALAPDISKVKLAVTDWKSTGTAVTPPVTTGGGASSKLVGMAAPPLSG